MSAPYRVAIVVSRFNRKVTDKLLAGARAAAEESGLSIGDADIYPVPGAFELPILAKCLADSERYDGVICLGAVIRGETAHFDYVSEQASAGIQRVALDTGVPVTFGVLTTNSTDEALARAGGAVGNKGYDSVVSLVQTLGQLKRAGGDG